MQKIFLLVIVIITSSFNPPKTTYTYFTDSVVSSKQISILNRAAGDLEKKSEDIRNVFKKIDLSKDAMEAKNILRDSLISILNQTRKTEEAFVNEAKSKEQSDYSRSVFSELYSRYSTVLDRLTKYNEDSGATKEDVEEATFLIERNQKTFEKIAKEGKLTVTLSINSEPDRAKIYMRKEGTAYKKVAETNRTFEDIKYAKWYIKVEAKNYKPVMDTFDAFTDERNQITFYLEKK